MIIKSQGESFFSTSNLLFLSFLYYVAKLENIFNRLCLSKKFSNTNPVKAMSV